MQPVIHASHCKISAFQHKPLSLKSGGKKGNKKREHPILQDCKTTRKVEIQEESLQKMPIKLCLNVFSLINVYVGVLILIPQNSDLDQICDIQSDTASKRSLY